MRFVGLSDEAKTVARRLNLSGNQSALISAAGAGGTKEQIAALHATASRLRPPSPERIEQKRAEVERKWQNFQDWKTCAAETLLEWIGPERGRQLIEMIDNIGFDGIGAGLVVDHLRVLLRQRQE